MKYKTKYDKAYGLPIATKEHTLAQIEEFLDDQYEREEWEERAGDRPNRDRRIILYALRVARRAPANDRRDQLFQLCRKFISTQPRYWPRFLRERYQYAKTKDFFSIDYNDIIWEYYTYDDECSALKADPDTTGRVFDANPHWEALMRQLAPIMQKVKI